MGACSLPVARTKTANLQGVPAEKNTISYAHRNAISLQMLSSEQCTNGVFIYVSWATSCPLEQIPAGNTWATILQLSWEQHYSSMTSCDWACHVSMAEARVTVLQGTWRYI